MSATYDLHLVILSYAISVLGSFTALRLATRIPSLPKQQLWPWLLGAAGSLGGGAIWSMHFIAMLAYKVPIPVTYDPLLTVASAFIAIVVTGIGLYIMGRGRSSTGKLVLAALFTGVGVAAMHYTGMAAMQMAADIQYNMALVGLSFMIAIGAASAALWLAFNLRGNWQRFSSALVMGAAISGMHYTGMAAVTMVPNTTKVVPTGGVGATFLAMVIFGVTAILMIGGLIASARPLDRIHQGH